MADLLCLFALPKLLLWEAALGGGSPSCCFKRLELNPMLVYAEASLIKVNGVCSPVSMDKMIAA